MKYDYVVVGSGLFGSVFAQQMQEHGRTVLVLEKRSHIGGNCFTYEYEDTGITVHKYGTHIFHTNDRATWDYLCRFTRMNRYRHRVLTTYRDRVYSMPINLGTVNAFYGVNLRPGEVESFLAQRRPRIEHPRNLEEKAISLVGEDLYVAFIRGYTHKQWGCDPRDLPASIITRLPVRRSYDDGYFDDAYQGLPMDGYTRVFERLLEGVAVETGTDFLEDPAYWRAVARRKIVYTGPIDRYFDYAYGRLSWRSVRFEVELVAVDDYQGTSVMNFADVEVPHTRVHEPKHLHPERRWNRERTVVMREYSHVDHDRPYYPVSFRSDRVRLAQYQRAAQREPRTIFGGRLARYRYYDMHQVIAAARKAARDELECESQLASGGRR